MNFLIQTIYGRVKHDFAFALLGALEFYAWTGDPCSYQFIDHKDLPRVSTRRYVDPMIPVGSVEFVHDFMTISNQPLPPPINVPPSLFTWAGREIYNGTEKDEPDFEYFAKNNDIVKAEVPQLSPLPPGNYQFSTIVDFTSEWRCFVWRGTLVGLQNYAGDFTEFPNVGVIKEMIAAYKNPPCAYTLDAGLVEGRTCVVEVHNFYSCGLYGFEDLQLLPLMLAGWYREYTRS